MTELILASDTGFFVTMLITAALAFLSLWVFVAFYVAGALGGGNLKVILIPLWVAIFFIATSITSFVLIQNVGSERVDAVRAWADQNYGVKLDSSEAQELMDKQHVKVEFDNSLIKVELIEDDDSYLLYGLTPLEPVKK